MGVQEARAEVIHPSKSGKSVGFRLLEWQLKRALKTLGGALVNPDALESWDAWKPKPIPQARMAIPTNTATTLNRSFMRVSVACSLIRPTSSGR